MLWERDGEFQCLRDALRACREGRGTTVFIAGEAGIGKTSLLRTFASQIEGEATVFAGTCDDLHTARTLGPFQDGHLVQAGSVVGGCPRPCRAGLHRDSHHPSWAQALPRP